MVIKRTLKKSHPFNQIGKQQITVLSLRFIIFTKNEKGKPLKSLPSLLVSYFTQL